MDAAEVDLLEADAWIVVEEYQPELIGVTVLRSWQVFNLADIVVGEIDTVISSSVEAQTISPSVLTTPVVL